VGLQVDPFPGSGEYDKKVHCCSVRMLIFTDKSQQNLRFFSVKVKNKNVNSQQYPSHTTQDIQSEMHSSCSDFALIMVRSK